jgi:hypothetical protein
MFDTNAPRRSFRPVRSDHPVYRSNRDSSGHAALRAAGSGMTREKHMRRRIFL